MPPSSDHSEELSPAERALAEFLRLLEGNEKPDFEAFCAERPEIKDELRSLHGKLCALSEELRGSSRTSTLAERMKQIHGPDVNPDITLEALQDDMEAESSFELLKKLSAHAAPHTRYRLNGEVARGGMGVILKAWDEDLRRNLAMKVILGTSGDDVSGDTPAIDPAKLSRFLEEAQVTGQLEHPGIVPVHELGLDAQGRVYFTMRLVKGRPLNEVIDMVKARADGWSVTRALSVILDICEAMAFAHDKGVIHRDLKPANVMVGKYGETYVMDWGLSRVLGRADRHDIRPREPEPPRTSEVMTDRRDETPDRTDSPLLTRDGTALGTPAYMPPEQALGKLEELGPAADVYAVGAILYHLLTGAMPYAEAGARLSPHTLLALVIQGPPRAVHELSRENPAALEAICEKAMARRISDRYPSMEALASDLRAFLEDRVVAAYESGAMAELKKWIVRNKGVTAVAVAAAVIIAALTGWFVANLRSERNLAEANGQTAVRERDRADQNAARATDRKEEFDQLAGVVLLKDAQAAEKALYPAWPQRVDAMESWLSQEAAKLVALKPTLSRTLSDMEGRATLQKPDERERDRRMPPLLAGLDSQFVALEAGLSKHRTWLFETESQRFLYTTLSELSQKIVDFEQNEKRAVEQRLFWARRIEEMTRQHPNAVYSWDEAREALAAADGVVASELYREHPIDLQPQMGLVPIGVNPVTLLWEFYHLRSAWDPASDVDPVDLPIPEHAEDGSIGLEDGTGIVFVLIPGGTFRMGAQKVDPEQANYEPQAEPLESPVHKVRLSPYFLARHELTQGQWRRLTGQTPSYYNSQSMIPRWNVDGALWNSRHPLEKVSWEDCDLWFGRLELTLPTEAQWEYGCRAGTETPWWTGMELADLDTAGNLADQYGHDNRGAFGAWERLLDDGHACHAEVGKFRANAFGLFDTIGNVWEWCRDREVSYNKEVRPSDGFRGDPTKGGGARAIRGGSFGTLAARSRSASRYRNSPDYTGINLGVRPARNLH